MLYTNTVVRLLSFVVTLPIRVYPDRSRPTSQITAGCQRTGVSSCLECHLFAYLAHCFLDVITRYAHVLQHWFGHHPVDIAASVEGRYVIDPVSLPATTTFSRQVGLLQLEFANFLPHLATNCNINVALNDTSLTSTP